MNDAELRRFGQASRFMCSPAANFGKPPRENFVVQLREAEAEWQRRTSEGRDNPRLRPSTAIVIPTRL